MLCTLSVAQYQREIEYEGVVYRTGATMTHFCDCFFSKRNCILHDFHHKYRRRTIRPTRRHPWPVLHWLPDFRYLLPRRGFSSNKIVECTHDASRGATRHVLRPQIVMAQLSRVLWWRECVYDGAIDIQLAPTSKT